MQFYPQAAGLQNADPVPYFQFTIHPLKDSKSNDARYMSNKIRCCLYAQQTLGYYYRVCIQNFVSRVFEVELFTRHFRSQSGSSVIEFFTIYKFQLILLVGNLKLIRRRKMGMRNFTLLWSFEKENFFGCEHIKIR